MLQQSIDPCGSVILEGKEDFGVLLSECLDKIRKRIILHTVDAADCQVVADPVILQMHGLGVQDQHAAGDIIESRPFYGETDAVPAFSALEQADSELIFERDEPLADGRFRKIVVFGGSRKASGFAQIDKKFQGSDVHYCESPPFGIVENGTFNEKNIRFTFILT